MNEYDENEEFRIFTETSEELGVLYDSYKSIPGIISKFMDKLESAIKKLVNNPTETDIDLSGDIRKFKEDVGKKFTPSPINVNSIKSMKAKIQSARAEMDTLLNRLTKAKRSTSFQFGGTNPTHYLLSILNKPKIYSKNVDEESYSRINKNVRNVNRGLDWVEHIMIDMYNMIDQDRNILTIVDRVYVKNLIYESMKSDLMNEEAYEQGLQTASKSIDLMYECGMHKGPGIDGDDIDWLREYLREEGETLDEPPEIDGESKESMPKQADKAESDKNGANRKKLYIAFIEWSKKINPKNAFGSLFDKDIFTVTYPFVPNEMRYFYRLANPILCVLSGHLTFFQVSELRTLNKENKDMNELLIFAATQEDMRVFNTKDKKVYRATEENGALKLNEVLGESFDLYIQNMINQGDILNGNVMDETV